MSVKFDYQIQTRKKIGSIQCYVLVTADWCRLDGAGRWWTVQSVVLQIVTLSWSQDTDWILTGRKYN